VGGVRDPVVRGDEVGVDSSEIVYTGTGGNVPATGKQIAARELDQSGNAGLVTSQLAGLPVRVIRGYKGDPDFSPTSGYRYDVLYRVTGHWSKIGKSGFRIWRYMVVRLSPQEEAP
jgi:putative restriction endonuclease